MRKLLPYAAVAACILVTSSVASAHPPGYGYGYGHGYPGRAYYPPPVVRYYPPPVVYAPSPPPVVVVRPVYGPPVYGAPVAPFVPPVSTFNFGYSRPGFGFGLSFVR